MKQKLLHTPEGVRDIYNRECEEKLTLQDNLYQVLKSYGYRDIETPTFEFFDVFGREVGTIPSKDLYKFFDREGNTLVLRPDITPSIARAAAKYFSDEEFPIRLCYKGNTFINNSSYQGRLKETTELGVELIGDSSVEADAEIVAMVVDTMRKAGLRDFQISIGQADFFKSLQKEAGIDEETEQELKQLISNKNHFGVEELLSGLKIRPELKRIFTSLPQLFGNVDALEQAAAMTDNPGALLAINRLYELHQILKDYGFEQYISFDLGMLSNYMYYTGIIFRAYTYGTGGAIVKGGRYDGLLGHFGKPAPSIGFVVVLEQLLRALSRQKIRIPLKMSNVLYLYDESRKAEAIKRAQESRANGINVELMKKSEEKSEEEYIAFAKKRYLNHIMYFRESGQEDTIYEMN